MSGMYRVLSLDGGGIRGTYAAAFLAGIEQATGKRIVDHFDLIVGTSTGGIIALGLGLEIPPSEILRFYVERGPEIFPLITTSDRIFGVARQIVRAKHSTAALRSALTEIFGERLIGESIARLMITAYDGSSGDVHLYKTAHHPKFHRDFRERAVDVALATSAAPTYLPSFVGKAGTTMVDGGVWANCPAAVAVTEALTTLEQPYGSVHLLSVGTTEAPMHVPKSKAVGGIYQWARFAPELLMQAQAKGALSQAKLLTGNNPEKMLRITEIVAPGRFKLDDPRCIEDLRSLGDKASRHYEGEISRRFLVDMAEPFIPFRGPRSSSAN